MEPRDRITRLLGPARTDLAELVAIPSVADPRQYPKENCLPAAEWVADRFGAVGFADVRLIETCDGSLAVHGVREAARPDAVRPLRRSARAGRRRLAHPAVRADRVRRPLVRPWRGAILALAEALFLRSCGNVA
jgi:acetylornithine deacetylase/succinyl-diaminopimelate desuccinylase-like protein